jgi:hypothetical protein
MTNIINDLIVGTEFTVEVSPADAEMFDGALIFIQFNVPLDGEGINSELVMGADDWRRWRRAVDDALRDAAVKSAGAQAVVIPFMDRKDR